jgi:hypothetical protein
VKSSPTGCGAFDKEWVHSRQFRRPFWRSAPASETLFLGLLSEDGPPTLTKVFWWASCQAVLFGVFERLARFGQATNIYISFCMAASLRFS